MVDRPQPGQLQLAVERLVNNLVTQIGNLDPNPIDSYLEMLVSNPIAGAGFMVKTLLTLRALGDYRNSDPDLQAFIHKNLAQMQGSFKLSVAEMMIATAIGYSFSEVSIQDAGGQWMLQSILSVDPRRYRFEGKLGQITDVLYYAPGVQGNIPIPYSKGVHIVNAPYLALGRDPYGVADCRRAIAAWTAWKLIVAEMVIAGQRMATPIIAMQVPSAETVTILDKNGNPLIDPQTGAEVQVPVSDRALEQLEALENRSVLVTDLQNKIQVLEQQGRDPGKFFFEALRYLERIMLLGQLIPETVLSSNGTGSGDSNLNAGHLQLLMLTTDQITEQIKEALLEQVIHPLIEWNFGPQEDWGDFVASEEEATDRVQLMGAIANSVSTGVFSAADLAVVNRQRQLAGIPPTDEIVSAIAPTLQPATNGNGKIYANSRPRQDYQ